MITPSLSNLKCGQHKTILGKRSCVDKNDKCAKLNSMAKDKKCYQLLFVNKDQFGDGLSRTNQLKSSTYLQLLVATSIPAAS